MNLLQVAKSLHGLLKGGGGDFHDEARACFASLRQQPGLGLEVLRAHADSYALAISVFGTPRLATLSRTDASTVFFLVASVYKFPRGGLPHNLVAELPSLGKSGQWFKWDTMNCETYSCFCTHGHLPSSLASAAGMVDGLASILGYMAAYDEMLLKDGYVR